VKCVAVELDDEERGRETGVAAEVDEAPLELRAGCGRRPEVRKKGTQEVETMVAAGSSADVVYRVEIE
jgi:hypothetical protein